MDRKELESYQLQLAQVELALVSDPDDKQLTSLRSELQELISLTQMALEQVEAAAAAAASSKTKSNSTITPSVTFSAGDECLAKYSGDGQWYPARITSIGGSEEKRVYSIVFKGYNSTELVAAGAVKPLPASHQSSGSASSKRKITDEEEAEIAKKRKKNERRNEVRAEKAKEQNHKKAAWQTFAKKSEKKGVVIAGVQGKSIFQTPDNAHGRVGVTNSGKGMSASVTRTKHKFGAGDA